MSLIGQGSRSKIEETPDGLIVSVRAWELGDLKLKPVYTAESHEDAEEVRTLLDEHLGRGPDTLANLVRLISKHGS